MERFGDLDHPLAYRLTMDLAIHHPDSRWIRSQEEKRQALLARLEAASPQELFDNYPVWQHEITGLVLAENPLTPTQGKVGLEIEFKKIAEPSDPDGFSVGTDPDGNDELRRNNNELSHDRQYVYQIAELYRWFKINSHGISSLHLHLDKMRHPIKPLLQVLLDNIEESTIEENHLGTWEIRGLGPPLAISETINRYNSKTIDPIVLESLIALYIHAATEGSAQNSQKIQLSRQIDYSAAQILFGHIASTVTDPEAKLAALFTLKNKFPFLSINPFSFAYSYTPDSFDKLSSAFPDAGAHMKLRFSLLSQLENIPGLTDYTIDQFELVSLLVKDPQRFQEPLKQALMDENWRVRGEVVKAFATNPKAFEEPPRQALMDENWHVRLEVVKAFATDPKVFEKELRLVLKNPDEYADLKRFAKQALSSLISQQSPLRRFFKWRTHET